MVMPASPIPALTWPDLAVFDRGLADRTPMESGGSDVQILDSSGDASGPTYT